MSDDFNKLKSILLKSEIDKIDNITKELSSLKNQQRRDILVENLSHIITHILAKSIEENQLKVYSTLQPIISKGVLNELNSSNDHLKKVLFPIISSSLQEQVHNQRDAIVDALYPIMGNMISKYVSTAVTDMVYEVNNTIHNSLSMAHLKRKIKSKIYGISEAQLLIEETSFLKIEAIFLIHKESGLLIVDLHREDDNQIEEVEMVASMLSAIRSFVNDWISNHDTMSEISEIEYGSSSISIESAGSCYLAVVTNGYSPIKDKLSKVLSEIVDRHSKEIVAYDGDKDKIDIEDIKATLSTLFSGEDRQNKKSFPFFVIFLILSIISSIGYIYGTALYKERKILERECAIREVLDKNKIHIYDLDIESRDDGEIIVNGIVSSMEDKKVANSLLLKENITSHISSIDDSFYKNYTRLYLEKIIRFMNRKYNSNLTYKFNQKSIAVIGTIIDEEAKEEVKDRIGELFDEFNLLFHIKTLPLFKDRVYFKLGSSRISEEYQTTLDRIVILMKKYKYPIGITGYTDLLGKKSLKEKISFNRALNVKNELIKRGINEDMLLLNFEINPPDDVDDIDSENGRSLSRCVIFNWELK